MTRKTGPDSPQDAEATSRLVGHAVLIAGALGVAAAAAVLLWPRELMGLYGVQLTGCVDRRRWEQQCFHGLCELTAVGASTARTAGR